MFPKEFIIENGQVYYRKKPVYQQPLFWTTSAGGVLSFLLGLILIFTVIGMSVTPAWTGDDSAWSDDYDRINYTYYYEGESALFDDGLKMTVRSMELDPKIKLVYDDEHDVGMVIKLELENTSKEDVYLNECLFMLKGNVENYELNQRTYDDNLPEKIKPGEKLEMKLIYGVYSNDTSYSFIYDDAAWLKTFGNSL